MAPHMAPPPSFHKQQALRLTMACETGWPRANSKEMLHRTLAFAGSNPFGQQLVQFIIPQFPWVNSMSNNNFLADFARLPNFEPVEICSGNISSSKCKDRIKFKFCGILYDDFQINQVTVASVELHGVIHPCQAFLKKKGHSQTMQETLPSPRWTGLGSQQSSDMPAEEPVSEGAQERQETGLNESQNDKRNHEGLLLK